MSPPSTNCPDPYAFLAQVIAIHTGNRRCAPGSALCQLFVYRQGWHLDAALVLGAVAWLVARPALGDGAFLGIDEASWFWGSVAVAALQQLLGWLVFRGQLGWGVLTRWFGKADLLIWGGLSLPLLIARPLFHIGLAVADSGSMSGWPVLRSGIAVLLVIPSLYSLWSNFHYFGVARALGGDHFRMEYCTMPFVREGAFRWSSNAMYSYGFLLLWAIALTTGSRAALAMAGLQHAFVWAHYYCTEVPDMQLMYGDGESDPGGGSV